MKSTILSFFILISCHAFGQQTVFEKSAGKQTATYHEVITFYQFLTTKSKKVKMLTAGPTDAGLPLHVVYLSNDGSDVKSWHKQGKIVFLINNGIHPGEPDGIDASMMLARDVANGKIQLPNDIGIAIIPVYNIGGMLNRGSYGRVNQDGPEEYGFRGNSQNLDLNRDFIKCDSREAKSFSQIFQQLNPDVFLDTHVSDGADYQHTITLITTQYEKLGGQLGQWLKSDYEPAVYGSMKQKGHALIPYVDFDVQDFSKGMKMFYDPPRYSTGYAALFGTLSFMSETHMLKPYAQRVSATYDLIKSIVDVSNRNALTIKKLRQTWLDEIKKQEKFPLSWSVDSAASKSSVHFMGYAKDSMISAVTGVNRMYFNHQQPYTLEIPYYNGYKPVDVISKPKFYVLPQGWHRVVDLLQSNKVKMDRISTDTIINVTITKIENQQALARPYESHYKHYGTKTSSTKEQWKFRKGDWLIPMNQTANRFIVEVLEPTGDDGYFSWNYFDAILQQKEGYSTYRWEDVAAKLLKENPELKSKLEEKKQHDTAWAKKPNEVLNWMYKQTPHYEKSHNTYPIFRIE